MMLLVLLMVMMIMRIGGNTVGAIKIVVITVFRRRLKVVSTWRIEVVVIVFGLLRLRMIWRYIHCSSVCSQHGRFKSYFHFFFVSLSHFAYHTNLILFYIHTIPLLSITGTKDGLKRPIAELMMARFHSGCGVTRIHLYFKLFGNRKFGLELIET
jgi:hypothetical protein